MTWHGEYREAERLWPQLARFHRVWRLPPRRQGVVRLEAPPADEEALSATRADGTSDARS